MRYFLAIALLLIAVPAKAEECEGFRASMSALEHAMGIEPPAKKSHAPQNSREVNFRGEKLSFIARSPQAGATVSNLGVYQFKRGEWQLIKSISAAAPSITFQQAQDKITFYPTGSRAPLLTLTQRDLI